MEICQVDPPGRRQPDKPSDQVHGAQLQGVPFLGEVLVIAITVTAQSCFRNWPSSSIPNQTSEILPVIFVHPEHQRHQEAPTDHESISRRRRAHFSRALKKLLTHDCVLNLAKIVTDDSGRRAFEANGYWVAHLVDGSMLVLRGSIGGMGF